MGLRRGLELGLGLTSYLAAHAPQRGHLAADSEAVHLEGRRLDLARLRVRVRARVWVRVRVRVRLGLGLG